MTGWPPRRPGSKLAAGDSPGPGIVILKLIRAGSLLVLAGALAACAQLAPRPPSAPVAAADAQAAPPSEDPQAQLQYHVLVAELASQRNAMEVAAFHYLEAAKLSSNPELAESATRHALLAGNEAQALLAALRWSSLAPEAVPPRELIARNHLRQGRLDALYAECTAIIARHPQGRDEGYREVALLLSADPANATDTDRALAVMQRLVNDDLQRAAAHYAYGLLAVRLGRHELGIQQADAALKIEPDWSEAYLLKLGGQVRAGLYADASRTLALALRRASDPQILRIAYARLLLEAEQTEAATVQYREVLKADETNPDALFALGLLALQAGRNDEAHRQLMTLFESGQRRDEAAWFLAQIEEERGNYPEAYQWYGAVTGGSRVVDALLRRAYTLLKFEGIGRAQTYLADLRQRGVELGPRLYAAEAELYYENRQPSQALARYQAGLDAFPDEPELLYGRAMMHAELDDFAAAETDLRKILAAEPDNPRSLNALGYLLTNHSDRYQEAHDLIARALSLTPDDPAVIDSMGWVQYRLGNLERALELLKQAFARQPDPEIAAHLGEVLWHLGQRQNAKDVWRNALAGAPDHRVLRETVDRLSQ